jgi:hypothetical protein
MKLNINGKIVEVDDSVLASAMEEKKETIEIKSDLVIRSSEDETTFAANKRTEGIAIGAEIGRKEVLKGFGLEGDGLHKSDESSINAIKGYSDNLIEKALTDAKVAPDKKVTELTNDIATLKGTIETLNGVNDGIKNEFQTYKNHQLMSSALANEVPENALNSKADTLTLMNSKIKLDVNENGVVFGVGNDGQPMKDPTTLDLLPVSTIASNFFNENNHLLKPASGGAGGGDSGDTGGKQSFDAFIKEQQEAGVQPNSPQFVAIMTERQKAGLLES